jgi:hypothetical protein
MTGGYPWQVGDALLAADLNAAIAGATVPVGGSIQAAIDALPASGGTITLSPNTTYTLTSTLNITKPNVTITAPGWSTIIQRGPGVGALHLISGSPTATGFTVRNLTVDGNGSSVTGGLFEIATSGDGSCVEHCQVIRAGGQGHIALSGVGSRAESNHIVGLGSSTAGGYGIWAINHQKTFILNNYITGTQIDAIGFDGPGTQVIGNYVLNCQCNTDPGGQIAQYSPGSYPGALIQGNHVGQGGGSISHGIELNGSNVSVVGNAVINQKGNGIAVDGATGSGILVSGNMILNNGQVPGAVGGIQIFGPLDNVTIVGNRISDTQATHTQAWGVWFNTGPFNNVLIADNEIIGNISGAISPPTGGTGYVFVNNLGAANAPGVPTINAANDAAAASAGVTIGQTYRNGSAIMVRVA